MSNLKLFSAEAFFKNGALLIIPPMVITFGLWGVLPAAYSPENFWKGIPGWLALLENIFRILVFSIPAILCFGKKEISQSLGWYLYGGGLAIYITSYLLQIFFPSSEWSQSFIGFTAPAWSTLFWFTGISLVCDRSWLPIPWFRAIYFCCALFFLLFHIGHAGFIYFNKGG